MRRIFVAVFAIILSIVTIIACKKSGTTPNPPPGDPGEANRKALLTHAADNLIIPAFENLKTSLGELKTSSDAFTAAPDAAGLIALRAKWKAGYLAWQKTELFHFGPADDVTLRNYFNIYPTDVTLLEAAVTSGSYNLDILINNKIQGMPALDYLLNGLASDNESIVDFYTGADGAKWKKYLTDVVAMMIAKSNAPLTAWKGTYRQSFVDNTGTGAGSSFSKMTNEYIMYFERFLRSGKYAIPAGALSGTPAPEKVEVFYSKELGTEMAMAALQAAQDFFQGKPFGSATAGPGLKSYLQSLNGSTLATNIDGQFETIKTKAGSLGNSIHAAVVGHNDDVLALYDEFQKQVRYFKVDMVSAIGISITYTDNDGD